MSFVVAAIRSPHIGYLHTISAPLELSSMQIVWRLQQNFSTNYLWIPFYEQNSIDKCAIMFKHIHGNLSSYLNEDITINNRRYSRAVRYCNYNAICPKYKRQTRM